MLTLDRVLGVGTRTEGFYTIFGDMPSGAGWLSGSRGYRRWYSDERVFFDTSASLSWRGYKAAQAQLSLPKLLHQRLIAGAQVRWQDSTQVNFYGVGAPTVRADRSQYRMQSTSVAAYAAVRPLRWMAVEGRVGLLKSDLGNPGGFFTQDFPPASLIAPNNPVFALEQQPLFGHAALSFIADTRDFPGHATRGGLVSLTAARFSDRDTGRFSFTRYEVEGERFVPLTHTPVVLAVHGWLVASKADDGRDVPFYLQPTIGGQNTLRSFDDYRFDDRHALVLNVEARVPVMTHLDGAAFVDAGDVAARIGDLDLARRSYGVGVQLHSRRQTFARVDLARGDEGWRVMFRLSDPLQLTRLTRRLATAPFVP